jgi:excisionase family DNA binding protein
MPTHTAVDPDWIADVLVDLPKVLTSKEAQKALRTSQRNLYRLVKAGRIHAVRGSESGSSRLLIPRASVEAYLRGLEVQ